jgi:ankyrin repeat protein
MSTDDDRPDASSAGTEQPAAPEPMGRRVGRRLYIHLLTRERRDPHWGVTLCGVLVALFSIYTIYQLGNPDHSELFVCQAAFYGDREAVRDILARRPDVLEARIRGLTPLHWAVAGGSEEMVEFLLDRGIDVNVSSPAGIRPLHIAAVEGRIALTKYLLGRGAKVRVYDQEGSTPLHFAVAYGYRQVSRELLKRQADVNAVDDYGRTPLHVSARLGYTNLTAFLLENDANVNAEDEREYTPLDEALENGHEEVARCLREAGGIAKWPHGEPREPAGSTTETAA